MPACGQESSRPELDPDPDPLVIGTDPDPLVIGTDPWIRIHIRTKMSRIPNTDSQGFFKRVRVCRCPRTSWIKSRD